MLRILTVLTALTVSIVFHDAGCALAGDAGGHAQDGMRCLKALTVIAAGTVPEDESFAVAACPSRTPAPAFRHDEVARFSRLARDVAAGEIVRRYPEFGSDVVRPGQRLTLVIKAGAISLERQVEALQPARQGQRLFVRASDGQVLSAEYGGD